MQFALRLIVLVLVAGIIGYFVLDLSPTTTEGRPISEPVFPLSA